VARREAADQSTDQTIRLSRIVPAMMERNMAKHILKRSCGRSPTVYAKDSMPGAAPGGSVNKWLGMDILIKRGEFGSLI